MHSHINCHLLQITGSWTFCKHAHVVYMKCVEIAWTVSYPHSEPNLERGRAGCGEFSPGAHTCRRNEPANTQATPPGPPYDSQATHLLPLHRDTYLQTPKRGTQRRQARWPGTGRVSASAIQRSGSSASGGPSERVACGGHGCTMRRSESHPRCSTPALPSLHALLLDALLPASRSEAVRTPDIWHSA